MNQNATKNSIRGSLSFKTLNLMGNIIRQSLREDCFTIKLLCRCFGYGQGGYLQAFGKMLMFPPYLFYGSVLLDIYINQNDYWSFSFSK